MVSDNNGSGNNGSGNNGANSQDLEGFVFGDEGGEQDESILGDDDGYETIGTIDLGASTGPPYAQNGRGRNDGHYRNSSPGAGAAGADVELLLLGVGLGHKLGLQQLSLRAPMPVAQSAVAETNALGAAGTSAQARAQKLLSSAATISTSHSYQEARTPYDSSQKSVDSKRAAHGARVGGGADAGVGTGASARAGAAVGAETADDVEDKDVPSPERIGDAQMLTEAFTSAAYYSVMGVDAQELPHDRQDTQQQQQHHHHHHHQHIGKEKGGHATGAHTAGHKTSPQKFAPPEPSFDFATGVFGKPDPTADIYTYERSNTSNEGGGDRDGEMLDQWLGADRPERATNDNQAAGDDALRPPSGKPTFDFAAGKYIGPGAGALNAKSGSKNQEPSGMPPLAPKAPGKQDATQQDEQQGQQAQKPPEKYSRRKPRSKESKKKQKEHKHREKKRRADGFAAARVADWEEQKREWAKRNRPQQEVLGPQEQAQVPEQEYLLEEVV
jgi:hypothetical protein